LPLSGILAILLSLGTQATQLSPIHPTDPVWISYFFTSILLFGCGLGLLRTTISQERLREGILARNMGQVGICLAYLALLGASYSSLPKLLPLSSFAYLGLLIGTHLSISSQSISDHLDQLKKTFPANEPVTRFLFLWIVSSGLSLWISYTVFSR